MKFYPSYTLIVVLLNTYFAQGKINQENDSKTKKAVDELLKKINDITVQSFSNASYSSKLDMLQNIESKLKKASKSLGKNGERYVKLIMKGIKAKALNEVSDNAKTQVKIPKNIVKISKFIENYNTLNDNRLKSTKAHKETENIDDERTSKNLNLNRSTEYDYENINKHIQFHHEHSRPVNIITNESDENQIRENHVTQDTNFDGFIQSLTPNYECEGALDKICLNIKEMRQFKCDFDDTFLPIEKLCNGLIDCMDKRDEKFCISQVTERIENANRVISQISDFLEMGCYPNKSKDTVLTKQIIILRSILLSQHEFVEKYRYFNYTSISNSEYRDGEGIMKRAVNELSTIISTVSIPLESELCSKQIKILGDEFTARKFNDLVIEDFDKVMDEAETPLKSCVCKGERCKNITTCTDGCKRSCWQKHSLTQWSCLSINETENVPVNVICDGKFDCFDQTDERDCISGTTFAKFEAHKIFSEILTSLSLKVKSSEYEFLRKMLLDLHRNVEDLQKVCVASDPDLKVIRTLRNKCLSSLSSIYSETLTKPSVQYLKSEVYLYLLKISENIVNALKRSHTGNKRIISSDGCYCRNGQCAMPICSKNCQKSCVAEPWLTKYLCEASPNKSVPLESICNGIPDCPKKDDEINCQKETCRHHHLTLLRHSLQEIGKKQKGTSMGEVLAAWKVKVSSTVLVAEKYERLTAYIIRDIVRDILNDLVITYGVVKDYRKNNEYALSEFTEIARNVMKFLKICGY